MASFHAILYMAFIQPILYLATLYSIYGVLVYILSIGVPMAHIASSILQYIQRFPAYSNSGVFLYYSIGKFLLWVYGNCLFYIWVVLHWPYLGVSSILYLAFIQPICRQFPTLFYLGNFYTSVARLPYLLLYIVSSTMGIPVTLFQYGNFYIYLGDFSYGYLAFIQPVYIQRSLQYSIRSSIQAILSIGNSLIHSLLHYIIQSQEKSQTVTKMSHCVSSVTPPKYRCFSHKLRKVAFCYDQLRYVSISYVILL